VFPITNETIREPTRPFVNTFHKTTKKTSLSAVIDRLATQQKKCIIIIIIIFIFIIITIVVITDLLLQVWIKLNLKCRMNDCFELPAHRRPCLKKKKCA